MTIDRHEWYAPPQWYRREDAAGIWQIENAALSSILYSSITAVHSKEHDVSAHPINLNREEACVDSPVTNGRDEEIESVSSHDESRIVGVPPIECDQIAADTLGRSDSKRRRVLEKSSDDTFVTSDCKVENIEPITDDNLAIDHEEGVGIRMNTSVENVMETALVMFEVH